MAVRGSRGDWAKAPSPRMGWDDGADEWETVGLSYGVERAVGIADV